MVFKQVFLFSPAFLAMKLLAALAASGHSETPFSRSWSPSLAPFCDLAQFGATIKCRCGSENYWHSALELGAWGPVPRRNFYPYLFLIPEHALPQGAPMQLSWSLEAGLGTGPQLVLAAWASPGALLAGVWEPGGLEGRTQVHSLKSGISRLTVFPLPCQPETLVPFKSLSCPLLTAVCLVLRLPPSRNQNPATSRK